MTDRHDCRDHLPRAASTGMTTRCARCGRWWFYGMTDNEFGRSWSWRRVYAWSLLGVAAVVVELVQRRGRR